MQLQSIFVGILVLLNTGTAWSAPQIKKMKLSEELPLQTQEILKSIDWPTTLSPENLEKMKDSEKRRGPAGRKTDQLVLKKQLKSDLNDFTTEFLKLSRDYKATGLPMVMQGKNPARDFTTELDQLLTKYQQKLVSGDEVSNDFRFAMAHLSILRVFRGYVWRLMPTVSESKVLQSSLITQVKLTLNALSAFLPSASADLVVAYLTEPLIENGVWPSLKTNKGKPLQQFPGGDVKIGSKTRGREMAVYLDFRDFVLPAISTAMNHINKIELNKTNGEEMVFDLALIYGEEDFASGLDAKTRYIKIGEVEKQLALAQLQYTLGTLLLQLSYTWDDSLKLTSTAMGVVGFDAVRGVFNPNGVTTQEMMAQLRRQRLRWGNFDTDLLQDLIQKMKTPSFNTPHLIAYEYFKNAVSRFVNAYDLLKLRAEDESFALWNVVATSNPMLLNFDRDIRVQLRDFVNGQDLVFISRLTGETSQISPKNFFTEPVQDLKRAFSIAEDQNRTNLVQKYQDAPAYRNYYQGRALKWDLDFYSKLYTSLKDCPATIMDCQAKLKRQSKILAESWVGFPLAAFLIPTLQ